ncbi:YIP1 family protein [Tabrizicola sp.]|uniref:YIP1 family protein n=1 Tax=Tabrizicola sp. TaxID=2005166 RepID=UPI003F2ED8CD
MTLSDRLLSLAQLTLQDPREATRALLAEDVPMVARTAGLLLVAVLSAMLLTVQVGLQPEALDPVTAFMTASPIRAAVMQWLVFAVTVLLIHRVGHAFGGRGSFPDALLIVVWLQTLLLGLQLLQLLATLLSPPIAVVIGLASLVLSLWLMTSFIAELHGFASRWAVFAGMIAVAIVTGLVVGAVVVAIVGPEVFVQNV